MSESMRSVLAALHSLEARGTDASLEALGTPQPFVTISREAGAGGRSLAYELVERLREEDTRGRTWEAFDRELVEKVAAEYDLPPHRVNLLTDSGHHWLLDLFRGMPMRGPIEPSEALVYKKVAETMLSLAEIGRVVLVGRGGAYLTRSMPGGLHVRLVAPLDDRVAAAERMLSTSTAKAREWVRLTDENRESFLKHYWPDRPAEKDVFDITLNTSSFSDAQMVDAIVPLVRSRVPEPAHA